MLKSFILTFSKRNLSAICFEMTFHFGFSRFFFYCVGGKPPTNKMKDSLQTKHNVSFSSRLLLVF